MEKLSKNIELMEEFQSSVNLSYDLSNINKIKEFIPTTSYIKVIEELFKGALGFSPQRARILVGPYGKGKSHMILVFLSILFNKDKKLFNNLLKKIREYNEDFYYQLSNYIESDKKILPIIVYNNGNSLTQAFLIALEETLKKEEFMDIMPETNFLSAIKTIENWEKNYKETYEKFISYINEPISNFIFSLKNYDLEKYIKFEKIFPKLTSGAHFNPLIGFNIVDIYEKVTAKLKSKGYQGIYLVYDEFSKYLENNLNISSDKDIKLLQDFAEKCDRNKSMNMLLICHKDINNYIDNSISKKKVDEWKGISGRFLHMNLSNNFSESFEIMSTVIKKEPKFWKKFLTDNKEKFEILNKLVDKYNLLENDDLKKKLVEGCYPLHPLTAFILPRLSEKIAQNERTLFTFLSSSQKNSLKKFINNNQDKFNLVTPDYIYDYFEPIIKNESYESLMYKNYKLLKTSLSKIEKDSIESKILKTLFLIYSIDEVNKVSPTLQTLGDIYGDITELNSILEDLEKKQCIVYLKRSNNFIKFKESSGKNIQNEINRAITKIKTFYNYLDILNDIASENYLYPNRYNDIKEIIRYFDFKFINEKQLFDNKYLEKQLTKTQADGIVFGIIVEDREKLDEVKNFLIKDKPVNKQFVFILSTSKENIQEILYEYKAVLELKASVKEDSILEEEYNIVIEDLEDIILSLIGIFINPESKKSTYYYNNKEEKISRKSQFSNLLSNICDEIFYLTPIINNEVINKNFISNTTVRSRNKIIDKLLEENLEYNLGFRGNSQEIFITRSLLINENILINENDLSFIDLKKVTNKELINIFEKIENSLKTSSINNPLSIEALYNVLINPKYHIGLKKGVIPLYLAVVLRFYKKNLVIQKDGADLKLTSDLLTDINDNPKGYYLYLEDWNPIKERYLKDLEEIFSKNIVIEEKTYNNYLYIIRGIKRWFVGLPKYSKEIKNRYVGLSKEKIKVPQKYIKFSESLKKDIPNSRDYLFNEIFDIYEYKEFNLNIIEDIKNTKIFYESLLSELINILIEDLKIIFSSEYIEEASLISVLKDWYEELSENTKTYVFSKGENRVLDLIKNISNDENEFLYKLERVVTSLRLEDWNEKTIELFLNNIKEIKNSIEKFNSSIEIKEEKDNLYKFIFIDENGKENVKTFEKIDYSPRAKLLLNEIENSIDEMGYSISEQEKLQVLIEILKKFY